MQLCRHKSKCKGKAAVKVSKMKEAYGKFECSDCSRKYSFKEGLYRHLRSCNKQKRQIHCCDVCEKVFQYKSQLTKHENMHVNKVDLYCHVCFKMFKRNHFHASHVAKCKKSAFADFSESSFIFQNNAMPLDSNENIADDFEASGCINTWDKFITNDTGIPRCSDILDDICFALDRDAIQITGVIDVDDAIQLGGSSNENSRTSPIYKKEGLKVKKIEDVIKKLSKDEKVSVLNKVIFKEDDKVKNDLILSQKYLCLVGFVEKLKEKFNNESAPMFFKYISETFKNDIDDPSFQKWFQAHSV